MRLCYNFSVEYKFIADDMLGKLARRLRMMGFDVTYPNTSADSLLLRLSREEDRIILTRDRGLSQVRGSRVFLLSSTDLSEQLQEVLTRLKLRTDPAKMFTRCPVCNGELKKTKKEEIKAKVPPRVYRTFDDFTTCSRCDKVYWKGTHYEKIVKDMPT